MKNAMTDQIVLITGASSGIGAASALQFAAAGCKVILTARREDRLQALAAQIDREYHTPCLTVRLDVQDQQQVNNAIANLPADWRDINILVNNAGLAIDSCKMQEGSTVAWDTMIDTNIKGLLYVTHAVLPNMLQRDQGHIINVGSIAGRDCYTGGNVYSMTKYAVAGITKNLRVDLLGTKLRVSEVAPGAVHTEFSEVRWQDKQKADDFYADFQALTADDIADGILYCATRPPHVSIHELLIMPQAQATANHLHRPGKDNQSIFN